MMTLKLWDSFDDAFDPPKKSKNPTFYDEKSTKEVPKGSENSFDLGLWFVSTVYELTSIK